MHTPVPRISLQPLDIQMHTFVPRKCEWQIPRKRYLMKLDSKPEVSDLLLEPGYEGIRAGEHAPRYREV